MLGGRRKTRLAVWSSSKSLCFYSSGLVKMKCPLSKHRPLKRKRPRLMRRDFTRSSTMVMAVVLSHIVFMEVNLWF